MEAIKLHNIQQVCKSLNHDLNAFAAILLIVGMIWIRKTFIQVVTFVTCALWFNRGESSYVERQTKYMKISPFTN